MKLTCPHSGVQYTISSGYGTASSVHPATQVPLKRLVSQLADYTAEKAGINSDQDRYLYLLAWFNCLPTVTYRDPASPARDHQALLAHQDVLFKTVLAIQQYPRIEFPSIVVSAQSTIHGCLRNWLDAFQSIVSDQKIRAKTQRRNIEVARMEETLDRITSHYVTNSTPRASKLIASWAEKVADFPTSAVIAPNGTATTIAELWKGIIHQSFMDSPLALLSANILPADLSELIEYCEDNVPHGTQHAYQLMRRLRAMESLLNELSGKPQRTATTGSQNTVARTEQIEQRSGSNRSGSTPAISSISEPDRRNFPTVVQYLRAKVRWQQSVLDARAEAAEAIVAATNRGKYAEL